MLEDFRLTVFKAVVKERSFTRAANVLGVSQPAVSQNVAELEKTLGVRLFERQRGETQLTVAGETFLTYTEKFEALSDSLDNMFSRFTPSVVRVAASEELYAHLFVPAVESFSRIHPEISFERSIFGDADLTLELVPAAEQRPEDTILRLRISSMPINKEGDHAATFEKAICFDVVFKPTPAFECTRLCRVIRDLLIS